MSGSDLAQLEALLMKVLPDPMGFVNGVMGELAGRLATAPGEAPTVVAGYEMAAHEALLDHNVMLAGALGACDCWGQDGDCPLCSGQGRAGWVEPNPALYDEYVAPAVRRVRAQDETITTGGQS
jgi:hypothetical protein